MGANKKKELENELSKLTILQLRQLSRKYSIDYTGSIRKNELIDKILASGVSLDNEPMISGGKKDDAEPPKAGAEAAPAVKAEPAKEALPLLKKEAAAPEVKKVEEPEKPAKKESAADKKAAEIREYINYMMNSKPSFFAIDGKLEAAAAMHNSGNYYGAIKEIQEARKLGSDIYSHFRIYTNALGINSAEKALEEAVKIGAISDDAAKKLLSSAMEGFVEGTPSKREHTLDKLESGAITVFDKIIGDLGKMIEVKQKKAEDLKQLGANVMEPSGLLLEADRMRLMLKLDEAKELVSKAEALLKKIETNRSEEIKYQIPRVRSAIEEAKSLGIKTREAEDELEKASYHYQRGDMKRCVEALVKAEISVEQEMTNTLASNPALKQTQLEKARNTVQRIGAFISEAQSFGIDVSEAQHYLTNTQMALNRNDPLAAPKFARRAEEITKKYIAQMDKLKAKAKHVTGTKCWKCGQEMLYDYENRIRRCSSCGAAIKM